ncbi:MAG: DUF4091 domain-containing protein, partial [Abditibacteriales bacterium]|nr:DUF4091 domain-containing protein [Abditibacteriales bacterium]MDW8366190.1 DUF6067 family protein [Abditibacteriales bacterium]
VYLFTPLVLSVRVADAQNLAPNPSFESGANAPMNWTLSSGKGQWENFGRSGKRCVSVTGSGEDANAWQTQFPVEAGGTYLVRYWLMSKDATGGTPISGFNMVNRDVPAERTWKQYAYVAALPKDTRDIALRFGQWHVKGTVFFDDVEVLKVTPIHTRRGDMTLGSGERIRNGRYSFQANLGGFASNYARCLHEHTAAFNTDRWVLGGPASERDISSGRYVIYRHDVAGHPFTAATVQVRVGYYESGECIIEASKDAAQWVEVGRIQPKQNAALEAPVAPSLFPAVSLFIRIRSTGNLQVNSYGLDGTLSGNPPNLNGETYFFETQQTSNQVTARVLTVQEREGRKTLLLSLRNQMNTPRQLLISCEALSAKTKRSEVVATSLAPQGAKEVSLPLPAAATGENTVRVSVIDARSREVLFAASAPVVVPWLHDSSFGYLLDSGSAGASPSPCAVWWCEGTYKVSRERGLPQAKSKAVQIAAARNEYEPFQIVLRPQVPLQGVRVTVSPLTRGQTAINSIEVALVEYVPITTPSDSFGSIGDYPDPLVPLSIGSAGASPSRFDVPANVNQPLWVTVYVPKDAAAGVYRGKVRIEPKNAAAMEVPVELRVFDFTLPDDSHAKTAYGVHIDNDWHKLQTPEQFKQVWDLYMQNCRQHRISPYSPDAYAPIKWKMEGPRLTIDNGALRLTCDQWQGQFFTVSEVGAMQCTLSVFEKEGVGYQGSGVSWPSPQRIKEIRFVERAPQRCVVDITAERVSSQPAERKFEVTYRFEIVAGQRWFTSRLLSLKNTDTVRWRLDGYYHLVPTAFAHYAALNSDRFGVWFSPTEGHKVTVYGAAAFKTGDFSFNLRRNPQSGHGHGDVYRSVGKWLEPGEVWQPQEPAVAVFTVELENQVAAATPPQAAIALAKGAGESMLKTLEKPPAPSGRIRYDEQNEPRVSVDFTDFDKAMTRYLDEFRFNGFNFAILPDTLGGHARFTPAYNALYKQLMQPILAHLKEKGWLAKAYCYWYDEPEESAYPYVIEGMKTLKEGAPGVRRLLTEQIETPLCGHVDLWVPIFHLYNHDHAKQRQALGEEVWWYVCTGPRAPYPNNFIDHPALHHRVRAWMAEKFGVDGELYWSATYYRREQGKLRNPWQDGMSISPDGYGWGNGDGMLLYPPVKEPPTEPVLKGPINSIRWELLREGQEDREYFFLLKSLLNDKGKKSSALAQGRKAYEEAMALVKSLTEFERDPTKFYAARVKVAEAIEGLQ